jgi:GT2 family glycosyltransferase/Tfp pilus assembly protein PilF
MQPIPILIAHFRAEEKLKRCLAAIHSQNYAAVEIFVRDNSEDNILFTAAVNEGLYKHAFRPEVEFVLILNQDAYILPDTLNHLVACMRANPTCGIACPIQLAEDGSVHWGGGLQLTPLGMHRCDPLESYTADFETYWSNGAAMLVRTQLVKDIGVLDSNMRFICSDADYALTARSRGWKVMVATRARVHHGSGQSMVANEAFIHRIKCEDSAYFHKKWLSTEVFQELAYEGASIHPAEIELGRAYLAQAISALDTPPAALATGLQSTVDERVQAGIHFATNGFAEMAEFAFQSALDTDANSVNALFNYAVLLLRQHQIQAAVDCICSAIECMPSSPRAYDVLGTAMCHLQQYAEGVECFSKAIALNSGLAPAYAHLGHAHMALHRYDAAVLAYSEALQLQPDLPQNHRYRAAAYRALGQDALATADEEEAGLTNFPALSDAALEQRKFAAVMTDFQMVLAS